MCAFEPLYNNDLHIINKIQVHGKIQYSIYTERSLQMKREATLKTNR